MKVEYARWCRNKMKSETYDNWSNEANLWSRERKLTFEYPVKNFGVVAVSTRSQNFRQKQPSTSTQVPRLFRNDLRFNSVGVSCNCHVQWHTANYIIMQAPKKLLVAFNWDTKCSMKKKVYTPYRWPVYSHIPWTFKKLREASKAKDMMIPSQQTFVPQWNLFELFVYQWNVKHYHLSLITHWRITT